jgi:hypothetical protein
LPKVWRILWGVFPSWPSASHLALRSCSDLRVYDWVTGPRNRPTGIPPLLLLGLLALPRHLALTIGFFHHHSPITS